LRKINLFFKDIAAIYSLYERTYTSHTICIAGIKRLQFRSTPGRLSKAQSLIPLLRRKFLLAAISFLFFMEIKVEVPERKTKTGAQKWVIHRVRKSNVEVVARFKGSWVRESMCVKSRV
jgi:hypothetical protein